MEKFEALKYRRIALKWSEKKLADRAGIDAKYVEFFEAGKNIGRDYERIISDALYRGTKELDNLEHYRFRIMELALKIQKEEDNIALLKELAHLGAEANKFQMDLMDADGFIQA